jgi:hypothetical protein
VIGTIAPGKNIEDLLKHLEGQGWGNHFIAWKDKDEIVSIRKLVDFERQYHMRMFSDGEVRGHYEYTPESHPKWHVKEVGFESRMSVFMQALENWIVPSEGSEVPALAED